MNQFDALLEIFEAQKTDIANLSTKVSELEKTNSFLLNLMENSNSLPPMCDPVTIQCDRNQAIKKEATWRSQLQQQCHSKDSTWCDMTLNGSFDDSGPSNITDKDDNKNNNNNSKPERRGLSHSDDICASSSSRQEPLLVESSVMSNSLNLQLKPSERSPIKSRINDTFKSILHFKKSGKSFKAAGSSSLSAASSSSIHSVNKLSDEGEMNLFDTVIAKPPTSRESQSVTAKTLASTESRSHQFPKTESRSPPQQEQQKRLQRQVYIYPQPAEDERLTQALDYVIQTLQNRSRPFSDDGSIQKSAFSEYNLGDSLDIVSQLRTERDLLTSGADDHARMKLLLTSQQLKAEMLHQSLRRHQQHILLSSSQLGQMNSSNNSQPSSPPSSLPSPSHGASSRRVSNPESEKSTSSIDKSPEHNSSSISSGTIKSIRQNELSRINKFAKVKEPGSSGLTEDPRIRRGFVKFTALIKGYMVRTLLQTDRVRNIIITIKDTAQMALSIRQERLSGDTRQPHEASPTTTPLSGRRTQQEALVFQHRLVAQLRTALRELHCVFFDLPASERVGLVRRHIDHLISVAAAETGEENGADSGNKDPFSVYRQSRPRPAAPPSSATVKRRQNLALRQAQNLEEPVSQLRMLRLRELVNGSETTAPAGPQTQTQGPQHTRAQLEAGDVAMDLHVPPLDPPPLGLLTNLSPVIEPVVFLAEEARSELSRTVNSTRCLRVLSQLGRLPAASPSLSWLLSLPSRRHSRRRSRHPPSAATSAVGLVGSGSNGSNSGTQRPRVSPLVCSIRSPKTGTLTITKQESNCAPEHLLSPTKSSCRESKISHTPKSSDCWGPRLLPVTKFFHTATARLSVGQSRWTSTDSTTATSAVTKTIHTSNLSLLRHRPPTATTTIAPTRSLRPVALLMSY